MKLDPEDEHLRGSLYLMTTPNGHVYAYLSHGEAVHRHLTGREGFDVDHTNGDTLDNRKANLRNVTRAENNRNSDRVWGRSRFKGVFFRRDRSRWVAYIKHNYKNIYLGCHATEEAANRARLTKEKELWGINPRRQKAFDEMSA